MKERKKSRTLGICVFEVSSLGEDEDRIGRVSLEMMDFRREVCISQLLFNGRSDVVG
jgi:hypothetical protein